MGRRQYTYVNSVRSKTLELTGGVPQGSVLGLSLFILCMNDVINAADANNIRLYADDTGIFLHSKNIYNLINHVENYFTRLKQWFVYNKLTVNADRS